MRLRPKGLALLETGVQIYGQDPTDQIGEGRYTSDRTSEFINKVSILDAQLAPIQWPLTYFLSLEQRIPAFGHGFCRLFWRRTVEQTRPASTLVKTSRAYVPYEAYLLLA